jgi:hypothetical protein
VASFYAEGFLGPASGLPRDEDQVTKRVIADERNERLIFVWCYEYVTTVLGGKLQVPEQMLVRVTLLVCPDETSLDGAEVVSSGVPHEIGVAVDPLLGVKRPKVLYSQVGVALDKPFQAIAVPLKGIGGTVLVDPIEKGVDDGRERMGRDLAGSRLAHQAVVGVVSVFSGLAQVMLDARDADEPGLASFTKPRSWRLSHDKPSSCD